MASVAFDINHPGISVYQALTSKELSEEEKAKIIAEAIDSISKEFPNLKHVATQDDLKDTELRLTKEIESVKLEIEKVRREIREIDAESSKEIKEIEAKLAKEIESVRLEIKELDIKLTKEIKDTKFSMLKWQFIFWLSQMVSLIAILYKLTPLKG